ncbi:hypothetical protein PUNSTDRAFT_135223 [Punctularia strigosozonata HHB-11173 SS5]|uniref:uncharacterized protein n=1 Tax=Punctularia strigosozonata (strain HHB-11173) TaxID=741275 RepID=UPI0004417623|nr:uncharacterized protein PUNSTDRAFT_135223 [Punctularia strigosozonata HHB-11173 SS5]EIN07702.1 hypothetical protein PUNSTDRAFT_135223 [Punctularia strigosozonata HHB-11173 SS5]
MAMENSGLGDTVAIEQADHRLLVFHDVNEHTSLDNDLDKIRLLLDQEIEALLARVHHLRERRNNLAPISRLPPEILSTIFRYSMINLRRPFPSSHSFSHVCQRFRDVALDCAGLWTLLPRTTEWLTELFLSRAKMHVLYCSDSKRLALPIFQSAVASLGHLSRVREIKLDHSLSHRNLVDHLSSPAPQLVSCSLKYSDQRLELLTNFLGLYAPQLRQLSLTRLIFKWAMLPCQSLVRNLTDLQLRRLVPNTTFPTGPQLADAVRSMPSLQKLVVVQSDHADYNDDWRPASAEPPCDVVVLHRLTSLELYGSTNRVWNVLQYIRAPSLVKISLGSRFCGTESPDPPPLTDLLHDQQTCREDGPPAFWLVVPWNDPECVEYDLIAYSDRTNECNELDERLLDLEVLRSPGQILPQAIIDEILLDQLHTALTYLP